LPPPPPSLFPYTTLFRSEPVAEPGPAGGGLACPGPALRRKDRLGHGGHLPAHRPAGGLVPSDRAADRPAPAGADLCHPAPRSGEIGRASSRDGRRTETDA